MYTNSHVNLYICKFFSLEGMLVCMYGYVYLICMPTGMYTLEYNHIIQVCVSELYVCMYRCV